MSVKDSLQKTDEKKSVQSLIVKMAPQIKRALPKHIDIERFASVAMTAVRNNPELQLCDQNSFLSALMQSSQLGLEVNSSLGEAFIIPYNSKKGKVAQFQLGYKGILTLAHNTGRYKRIAAFEVYENDEFDYCYGLEAFLTHKPGKVPQGEPVYYYAVYELKNGGSDFRVWNSEKIEHHAKKYSKAYGRAGNPWIDNFPAMAKKTVIIDLLRYAPKSADMRRALENEESIKMDFEGGIDAPNLFYDYEDAQVVNQEQDNQEETII